MRAVRTIARIFKPLDTTKADAALCRYERSCKDVQIRARALRMDIGCGDAIETVHRVRHAVAALVGGAYSTLAGLYSSTIAEGIPADMAETLNKLD